MATTRTQHVTYHGPVAHQRPPKPPKFQGLLENKAHPAVPGRADTGRLSAKISDAVQVRALRRREGYGVFRELVGKGMEDPGTPPSDTSHTDVHARRPKRAYQLRRPRQRHRLKDTESRHHGHRNRGPIINAGGPRSPRSSRTDLTCGQPPDTTMTAASYRRNTFEHTTSAPYRKLVPPGVS